MPCELYKHYDANGDLLYVGITVSTIRRTREHIKRAEWYDQIVRIEISRFISREDAIKAEEVAIHVEKPRFNKQKVERHWGLCPSKVSGAHPAERNRARSASLTMATLPKFISAVVQPAASSAVTTRFDRTGYQKEYMRKWRAKKRAKGDK